MNVVKRELLAERQAKESLRNSAGRVAFSAHSFEQMVASGWVTAGHRLTERTWWAQPTLRLLPRLS